MAFRSAKVDIGEVMTEDANGVAGNNALPRGQAEDAKATDASPPAAPAAKPTMAASQRLSVIWLREAHKA